MAIKTKPKWSKPKLIILVRSKPEEMVLIDCKGVAWGTRSDWYACDNQSCMSNCQAYSNS